MNISTNRYVTVLTYVFALLLLPLYVSANLSIPSALPTAEVSVKSNQVSLQIKNSNVKPGYNTVDIYHTVKNIEGATSYKIYEAPVASKGVFIIRPRSFEIILTGLIMDPGAYTIIVGSEEYQELHNISVWPDCDEIEAAVLEKFDAEDSLIHAAVKVSGLAPGELGIRYLIRYRYLLDSGIPTVWEEELYNAGANDLHLYLDAKGEEIEIEVRRLCDGYGASFSIASDWLAVGKIEVNSTSLGCDIQFGLELLQVGESYATVGITGELDVETEQVWILYGPQEIEDLAELKEMGTQMILSHSGNFDLIGLAAGQRYKLHYGILPAGEIDNIDGICLSGKKLEFETEQEVDEKVSELPSQERTSCGQPFDSISTSNSFPDPCYELLEGDLLRLGGIYLATVVESSLPQITQVHFPIVDSTFDEGTNGYIYDTTGYYTVTQDCSYESAVVEVQLPFQNKLLLVDLSDFSVNEFGAIVGGSINPQRQTVNVLPNVIAPIALGSNFCNPPPQSNLPELYPGQSYGFDTTGGYIRTPPFPGFRNGDLWDTTGTYDPNGFDVNGIHFATGSVWGPGPDSCNREGFNPNGQPCDPTLTPPYAWLHDTTASTTSAGLVFSQELKEELTNEMSNWLASLGDLMGDSISTNIRQCERLRADMNLRMSSDLPNVDRADVFGENDKYFERGMHSQWARRPEEIVLQFSRFDAITALEAQHQLLFVCDERIAVRSAYDSLFTVYSNVPHKDTLELFILEQAQTLSESQITYVTQHPDTLQAWIQAKIFEFLKPKLRNLGYVSNDIQFHLPSGIKEKRPLYRSLDDAYKEFNRFASVASNHFEAIGELSDEDLLELAQFEFAQGFQTVAGVDRVHFLAQLERQRNTSMTSGSGDESRLPLFLDQEIGSIRYTIILDNINFNHSTSGLTTTVDAYFVFYPPQDPSKMLVLQVQGLAFNPSGLVGQGRMILQTPFEFKMFDPIKITLNPTDTYVDWDCNGFVGMNLDMGLDICRKYLTPTDLQGNDIMDTNVMVHSDFDIYIQSWNSILVDDLSITPFRPTNVEQAHFVLTGMSVDFSDFTNSENLVFPENYETPHLNAGTTRVSNQWRGVHIEAVSATLPREEFGSANSSEPLIIAGHNLIFDQSGVSGLFTATNLVPLSEGDVGGWAASIDEITIGLLANQLTEGSVAGKLHIPLFGGDRDSDITDEDCVDYYARACANGFMLEATAPANGIEANVMLSNITLDQNTSIVLIKQEGQAPLIQATLSGKISIGGGELPVEIDDLSFQGLRISNQRPYVEISAGQAWELPNVGLDFKGFGLNIENARIIPNEDGVDLRFTTGLNLFSAIEDGSGSFAASGSFRTKGIFSQDGNGRQRMYFNEFKLDTFCLDVKINLNELSGKIVFFDESENRNSLWGKGFYGGIRLGIETKKGFKIEGAASAVFGSHNEGYKYFMVDAAAEFSQGIPIVPGLVINGFGGGVSRRMSKVRPALYTGLVPPSGYWPSTVGESLSGALFEPDNNIGFGFAIAAAFTTESSESLMNMTARLEAEFLTGGGVSRIGLGGSAQIMETPANLPIETDLTAVPPGGAMIKAIADISLDFENEEFSGSLISYIDVAQTIRGSGPSNRAGKIDVYFGSTDWHVKFGTPSQPIAMTFGIPGLDAAGLSMESYFMAGTSIEAPRELPENVKDLVGEVRQSSVFTNSMGNGVAFGSRFDAGFDTGNKIKPFTMAAQLGAGFDVGLSYLGNEATCENRSSPSVGINGWYARGQLYAYLEARIGLKAKLGNKEKEFKIANIAAAFMLQAELPNPFWAQGAVAVKYSVLGGLIEDDMNLQFEVGEQCVLVGTQAPTADLSIISSILPVHGGIVESQEEVVTINFLIPLDEEFSLEDFNENEDTKYLATVDSIGLQDKAGRSILGEYELNETRQVMIFTPYSMLPSNDTLTFGIRARIKEDGVIVETERRVVTFVTGNFVPTIPVTNISGSYPYDGQRNYYRKQLGNRGGVNIQLHRGQPDIVENPPVGYELIMELEYRASGNRDKTVYKSLSYDYGLDIIHVPVRTGLLARGGGYKAKLLYRDKTRLSSSSSSSAGASSPSLPATIVDGSLAATGPTASSFVGMTADPATSQGFYASNRLEMSGGATPPSPGAGASSAPASGSNTLPDIDLYEMYFRVSEFNTFIDEVENKFNSIEVSLVRSSFIDDQGVKTYYLRNATLSLPSNYLPDSREIGVIEDPLLTFDIGKSSLSGSMSDYMSEVNSYKRYDGQQFESHSTVFDCPNYQVGGSINLKGSTSNSLKLGEGVDFTNIHWRSFGATNESSNIKYELGEISGVSRGVKDVYEGVQTVYNSINRIDNDLDAYICQRCFGYGPDAQGCIDNPGRAQTLKIALKTSLLNGLPTWVKELATEDLPSAPSSFSGDLIFHYSVPVDGTPKSSVRVPVLFTTQ